MSGRKAKAVHRRTLSCRIAAICGLALFQGACAPDPAVGRLKAFDEVVFGRSANGPAVERLARWRVPVRIAVHEQLREVRKSRLVRALAGDELIAGGGLVFVPGPWSETTGCLTHELVHIMGLTYHPGDLYSILDHASNTDSLTSADRELLALLYNRRLVPGMARPQALRKARGILSSGGADESPL